MNEVTATVERLEMILRSEEDLYLRLRQTLLRDEPEMIELDPGTLARTVEEKRALAEEGRLLEESRVVVTRELAALIGLGEALPKLSRIAAILGDQAGELPVLHGRLSALIESNQMLIEGNRVFAHRSLGRVRDTLRLLGRATPQPVGYGRSGQPAESSGRGRLIEQAI